MEASRPAESDRVCFGVEGEYMEFLDWRRVWPGSWAPYDRGEAKDKSILEGFRLWRGVWGEVFEAMAGGKC